MTFESILAHVKAFFAGKEVHEVLSAADVFVKAVAPQIEADVVAFSKTLPSAFASLEPVAEKAIELVHDLKGVTISKSLAIKAVQDILTANWPEVVAEAEKLVPLVVAAA